MQIHYGPKYYSIIVRIMLLVKANLAYSAIPLTLYRNKVLSDLSLYVSYVSVLKPSQCNRKWGMVKIQLYFIINPPPTSQV